MTDNLPNDDANIDPVIDRIDFTGKDVLEVGCGAGGFTLEHLKQAHYILGIDPDEEAIETLKAEFSRQGSDNRVDFRQGNIVDFPLPEEAFDIIVFAKSF